MKIKTRKPDFVRAEPVFVRGQNVKRYFAYFGKRKVRISKSRFDHLIAMAKDGVSLDRKQGGRRGHGTVPGAGHCWPQVNEALACHPDQVPAFNARNKKHGINVEYNPKGFAIIPDEAAYRRLRKKEGVHHRNSYNG